MTYHSIEEIEASGKHIALIPSGGRVMLRKYLKKNGIEISFLSWHGIPDGEYTTPIFRGKAYKFEEACGAISTYTQDELLKILETLVANPPKLDHKEENGISLDCGYNEESVKEFNKLLYELHGIKVPR